MDYFPHDTDAVNDEKIEALRMLYGNDGYAFYFILLERIYRNKNAELDVSDAETKQILSRKIGITTELFLEILETCIKRKCFDREAYEKRGFLTSEGIKNRALPVIQKRENMRSKYNVGVSDAETMQKGGVSAPKVKESKVKKSKVNNKRTYSDFVTMTEEEYKKLIDQFGEPLTLDHIEKLNLYNGSTGKKYKSDYMTILNWSRKDKKAVKKDERTTNNSEQFNPDELSL